MNEPDPSAPNPLADALIAARLCAIDRGLGGIVLRGGGGESRDAVIAELRTSLPEGAPFRRLPVHVDDEALLGGLDLGATLARGATVTRRGLLVEAEGGVVVIPMAERLGDGTAARLSAAIDGGERFVVVALDDGIEAEERLPDSLAERLAFRIELSDVSLLRSPAQVGAQLDGPHQGIVTPPNWPPACAGERETFDVAQPVNEIIAALINTAAALGIDSIRAPLFALRAARAAAALAGRDLIEDEDLVVAARLVLAPRATRLPEPQDAPPADAPPPPESDAAGDEERGEVQPLDDVVLAAALAALPRDVLAAIAAGGVRRGPASRARGAGERRRSARHGRPVGVRAGLPRGGLRLSLIDTLRAAAPWQRLRGSDGAHVRIRRDDLRIRRFETRAEALTIFAVDASGSSALARLAEAKGAVELLLAEAYVKRAQVALVAFRGAAAELLLPPTRSLTRARRALAGMPGGGGTPLAAGLAAARELAEAAKARGRTPFVVVLTDGRANIAADGGMSRQAAEADADAAAAAIARAGIACAFVDISARPRPEGARIAAAMNARYLPLPRADAATMHAAVVRAQAA